MFVLCKNASLSLSVAYLGGHSAMVPLLTLPFSIKELNYNGAK